MTNKENIQTTIAAALRKVGTPKCLEKAISLEQESSFITDQDIQKKNQSIFLNMESNNKEKLALILGGITFLLFASQPYILDLIEPAKSIGQIIGENAKELIEGLNGEKSNGANSKREIWSNILSVLSFVLFAVTLFFSMNAIQNDSSKWYGVGGGLLSILGLGVYFFHLAIGFFGFVVLAILIVGLVLFSEFI